MGITLYTAPDCIGCKIVTAILAERGLAYDSIDFKGDAPELLNDDPYSLGQCVGSGALGSARWGYCTLAFAAASQASMPPLFIRRIKKSWRSITRLRPIWRARRTCAAYSSRVLSESVSSSHRR